MITLRFSSFSAKILNLSIDKFESSLLDEKLGSIVGSSRLPRKHKKVTLLRSPHVNNTSKEKFSYTLFSKEIKIKTSKLEEFISFVGNCKSYGSLIKVTSSMEY
jgi:ribosomal protein S10